MFFFNTSGHWDIFIFIRPTKAHTIWILPYGIYCYDISEIISTLVHKYCHIKTLIQQYSRTISLYYYENLMCKRKKTRGDLESEQKKHSQNLVQNELKVQNNTGSLVNCVKRDAKYKYFMLANIDEYGFYLFIYLTYSQ